MTASLIIILFTVREHEVRLTDDGEQSSFRRALNNRVVRGLFTYRAINTIGSGTIYSFLPLLAASFGATASQIGLLISVQFFLMSLLQRPFGTLADKVSKVKLAMIGGLTGSSFFFLIPYSGDFTILIIVNSIIGILWAISGPAITALAMDQGRECGMGCVLGLMDSATSLGMIIGPLIAGILMNFYGLPSVFFFSGTVGIIGIFLFYALLK